MSTLPRAATSPEQTKIRSTNQSSRTFLTVHAPATVFTARLAALPSSNDNVSSITYNTGSGAGYTDILVDQRVDIGTTAGAYDLGTTRVHNLSGLGAVTGTLNIERTSEIQWAANCYITVLDAFDLRPRPPYTDDSGVDFMDTSIAYSDQHSKCKSTPIFPRYHVKWLPVGGTVTVVEDATQSWALNNTITNYQFIAPGASAISGDSTSVCTITYNAANAHAGYRVELDLTNSDNADSTGYGRVFVLASASDAIEIDAESFTPIGSYQDGGWYVDLTLSGSDASRTTIRDRALCIIHRRDWYGKTASDEGSIGYITGDENIELVGWIAGETIKWTPDGQPQYVAFRVYGPQYWLDRITMPSVGLKNISSHPPTNWKRFTGLTAKSATWHILHWHTTAPVMMDCFACDSGAGALQLQAGGAQTVWQQISNVLNDFVMAKPCCDAYARLFMQVEQNLLSASARSSIPTVMTISKSDWENEIDFDRRIVNDCPLVDINGDVYDGTNTTKVYALCPGRTFSAQGSSPFSRERLAVTDQASLNTLAGAAFGWQNNPYPNWRFVLPSNMHLIDIAPYQYLGISIAAGDTLRGFTASNLRLIPREIRRVFQNGYFKTEVTIEAESTVFTGITGDTPATPPIIPVNPPPIPPAPPPPVPVPTGNAKEVWFATTGAIYWAGDYFLGGQPTWNKITTLPAGTPAWFGITRDGSRAYMVASGILYATSTPKTPSWTLIAQAGDSVAGDTITILYGDTAMLQNATVTITAALATVTHWAYGEYNGSAWAWSRTTNQATFRPDGSGSQAYSLGRFVRNSVSNTLIEDLNTSWTNVGTNIYKAPSGARYVPAITGGHLYIRKLTSASIDLGVGVAQGQADTTYIYGAETGPQVYTVSNSTATAGHLFLSDDGSSFADIATWGLGWIRDAQLTGGGSLVWVLKSISGSAVPTRLYNRDGSVLRDMTGNLWSLTSGGQSVVGMGLTY